jgi:membrane protease YdiL (CAAX protease family)
MTDISLPIRRLRIPSLALVAFVILTFAISWGIVAMYIIAPEWATSRFGQITGSHPLFFLVTWAPAISAFAIVLSLTGLRGMKAFLSRLLLWRCSWGWAAFIAIGIPIVYGIGSLIKDGPLLAPIPPTGVGSMVALLFMMMLLGPIEEFGWRGVAQPILQRHVAPLWAGMIIGSIWGIWHLPAFFLSGTVFATWNFLPFFIGNVTLAVLVTPLFNRARGSLLWPMLFHWQLINPFWPDAQPYDTWLLVVVAVVVVWWNRDTMLSRKGAITDVLPEDEGAVA